MRRKAKIHIGELYASCKPTVIRTLLGSCVSVCLYDPDCRIGGMNHILLPGKADLKMFDDAARYGINAMELLINELLKLGAFRRRLIAKFFGGAHIIRSVDEMHSPGLKNVEFVRNFLEVENIPIISEDIGGINARRIYFHTDTGDVFLKRVPAFKFSKIMSDEVKHGEVVRRDLLKDTRISMFK